MDYASQNGNPMEGSFTCRCPLHSKPLEGQAERMSYLYLQARCFPRSHRAAFTPKPKLLHGPVFGRLMQRMFLPSLRLTSMLFPDKTYIVISTASPCHNP